MKTENEKVDGIKRILGLLSQPEAERILNVVFTELLANPFLCEFERAHLEKRKREMLDLIEGEGRQAA